MVLLDSSSQKLSDTLALVTLSNLIGSVNGEVAANQLDFCVFLEQVQVGRVLVPFPKLSLTKTFGKPRHTRTPFNSRRKQTRQALELRQDRSLLESPVRIPQLLV